MHPQHIEAILERQARAWDMRQRLAERGGDAARRAMAHVREGPWVTVSRQLGSGGQELANRIAADLGWQVFDHEIVSAIARRTDTQEVLLSRLDEHAVGPINDYLARLLDSRNVGQVPFLQEMVRVIWSLAKQGSAVIVGRGANWFLGSRFGLRVRVVAPLDVRVARTAEVEGLDRQAAERRVREHDEAQEAFIRQVFGQHIGDPEGYDLIVNLGALDLDSASVAIREALLKRLELAS